MRRQPGPLIPPAVSFTDSSVSVPAEPAQSPTDSPDEAKRSRSLGGQSGFLARIAVCRTRSTHTRADTCLTSEAMCFCVRPLFTTQPCRRAAMDRGDRGSPRYVCEQTNARASRMRAPIEADRYRKASWRMRSYARGMVPGST